jgi:hypothetical protein
MSIDLLNKINSIKQISDEDREILDRLVNTDEDKKSDKYSL